MRSLFVSYGVFGLVRLCRDLIVTRLFYSKARIIRWPFYFRGVKSGHIGLGFTSGVGLRIDVFQFGEEVPSLEIGKGCQVNDYVHIACVKSIKIGDGVLIASKVFISDHNHGDFKGTPEMDLPPIERGLTSSPVEIGDRVWLGENVCVLPGVIIGKNSVVGAGSVVTHSIPENALAVGNPARVIKRFNSVSNRWERA